MKKPLVKVRLASGFSYLRDDRSIGRVDFADFSLPGTAAFRNALAHIDHDPDKTFNRIARHECGFIEVFATGHEARQSRAGNCVASLRLELEDAAIGSHLPVDGAAFHVGS